MKRLSLFVAAGISALALSSTAQAADLILEQPVVGVVDAGGDWEGMYVGAFVGGGFGLADHANDPIDMAFFCLPDGCDVELSGWMAGVTAGANFYISDGIIGGIAGDIAWSNVGGSDSFFGFESEHTINWQGSVRGVLGFDGGAFMPYLTAGLAVANASHTLSPWFPSDLTGEETHIGWTAGAGVAVAVADNVVLDLQYRFSDFGEVEYDEGFTPAAIFGLTQHAVTAGLNFQF